MIYTAALKGTNPDDANVCNIPTDAEELCIIAVTAAPAKIPKIGLCPNVTKSVLNTCDSLKGCTASDIISIPINNIPKPIIIDDISLCAIFFAVIIMITPTITTTGAITAGLKNFAHSTLETSQPVTVVPILAPIITLIDCVKSIKPAFTKPTTITVVAEELCIIAVTIVPSKTPITLFCVSAFKSCFILEPAAFCKPCAIICIP